MCMLLLFLNTFFAYPFFRDLKKNTGLLQPLAYKFEDTRTHNAPLLQINK